MSTVAVNYNFSTFRVKVGPNTVLNDVLKDSLKHYKLADPDTSNNLTTWILLHNDKPVSLDLPWRLINLSAGAKLELKQGQAVAIHTSLKTPHIVRIKLQVPGHETVIEKIDTNENLKCVLEGLAQKHAWTLDPQETKLQVFSKTVSYEELQFNTLSTLGIKESALIKLYLPVSNKQSVVTTPNKTSGPYEKPVDVVKEPKENKNNELHQISAFIPSKIPLYAQIKDEDEDDYELTVAHARIYQQMLSKQTGNLGGPMMSKRMREKDQEISKKDNIKECNVRVKFSDRTHIEISFAPEEDLQTVYQWVAKSLTDESIIFRLCLSHPYEYLAPSSKRLVDDLGFGHRTLLLFESQHEGPCLKKALLKDAKELSEAKDAKLDHSGDDPEILGNDTMSDQATKLKSSYLSSNSKKVPKWLKLSKN